MASKKQPFLLGEERWGEKVRRAYYRGRKIHGSTWKDLADAVSQVTPMSAPGLQRFMTYESKPTGRALESAWLLCLAMGVDPAELDISESEIQTPRYTEKKTRDLLSKPCSRFAVSAA